MKSLFVVIACFVCLVYGGKGGGAASGKAGGFRKPSCTIDGVIVPAGVTQRVGCRFCFCAFDGTAECTTFGNEGTCTPTNCAAPFVPNGKCCPVCPSPENPEFPALSGHGNNKATPSRGAVGTRLLRFAPPAYADGFSTPRQTDPVLPTAREVSQGMSGQATDLPDPRGLTAWVWQWGQFLDHDITLVTELVEHAENFDIPVSDCDLKDLNPGCADSSIHFQRANWARETGTGPTNFRQHVNSISTFVDASNVYGSDYFTNTKLRTGSNGRMKVHKDTKVGDGLDLMPSNLEEGITMAALDPSKEHFAAGDIRANEQQLLTTIHTIWVREHNRWAGNLDTRATNEGWDDERHFQEARKRVIAEMQIITFDEWLPSILGSSLPKYTGYQPNLEPGMTTEFVGAFYRFGHSMIRGDYPHLAADLKPNTASLTLEDLFFDSKFFIDKTHTVNGFARGVSATRAQAIDVFAVDALRNNLFDMPLDLVALNVQRGRDLGIPSLNGVRRALGLEPHADYDSITEDPDVRDRLRNTYGAGNVENVDPWIGALAEDPFYGSAGETLGKVLIDQFTRLRDGDRFFWLNWLSENEQAEVAGFSMKKLLAENGMPEIGNLNTENLFFCDAQSPLFQNGLEQCTLVCEPVKHDCRDVHGNVIGFAYPNPAERCEPYDCPCEACDHNNGPAVCGSDGTTYSNICALEQAQCSQSSLRYLHPGDCFDQVVTYFAGEELEIQQSVYGGPLLVEGQLHDEDGKGSGREYAIHFVDNCGDQTQLNPFASPQIPVPPVAHLTTDNTGEIREVLTEDVIISDVGTSSWLGGIDRSTVRTVDHSILNKAILFKEDQPGSRHACFPIEGPPFVVMTAELQGTTTAAVSLASALQGGATNIQTIVDSNNDGPLLPVGKYELRLSPDDCDTANPGIMNYAVPPGEYGVPPVADFEIHADALEDTFAYVNDRLKLIGSRTPINSYLRIFNVRGGNAVACGRVTLQEDPSECLLDNTANGGKGRGKSKGKGKGRGSNLRESEVISSSGDNHSVVYGNQEQSAGMQGFLQSATGVILLCTLIVILTVALIFVVIVAYVRSNPYTAPSALKRVASVTGDIRPTTPRG